MKIIKISIIFIIILSCGQSAKENIFKDEQNVLKIHQNYIEGWKTMDEDKILSLFVKDARIQPNSLAPINGKEKIRAFWFPKDSSKTTINRFETELLSLKIMDTIAVTTYKSLLDWSYIKDSIKLDMLQRGINTSIYRKQSDKTWKIWRQMWTDIYAKTK